MSKKHDWIYAHAPRSQHGRMVCGTCREKITEGHYKARDAGDKYVTHHRGCTLSDTHWEEIDYKKQVVMDENRARLAAYKAFRDKWDEQALDEVIDGLKYDVLSEDGYEADEIVMHIEHGWELSPNTV